MSDKPALLDWLAHYAEPEGDLSGLGKVGNLSFLVKIRQQSL